MSAQLIQAMLFTLVAVINIVPEMAMPTNKGRSNSSNKRTSSYNGGSRRYVSGSSGNTHRNRAPNASLQPSHSSSYNGYNNYTYHPTKIQTIVEAQQRSHQRYGSTGNPSVSHRSSTLTNSRVPSAYTHQTRPQSTHSEQQKPPSRQITSSKKDRRSSIKSGNDGNSGGGRGMAGELAEAAAFGVAEGAGGAVGSKLVDGLFNEFEGSGSASTSSAASTQNTNTQSFDQGSTTSWSSNSGFFSF